MLPVSTCSLLYPRCIRIDWHVESRAMWLDAKVLGDGPYLHLTILARSVSETLLWHFHTKRSCIAVQ